VAGRKAQAFSPSIASHLRDQCRKERERLCLTARQVLAKNLVREKQPARSRQWLYYALKADAPLPVVTGIELWERMTTLGAKLSRRLYQELRIVEVYEPILVIPLGESKIIAAALVSRLDLLPQTAQRVERQIAKFFKTYEPFTSSTPMGREISAVLSRLGTGNEQRRKFAQFRRGETETLGGVEVTTVPSTLTIVRKQLPSAKSRLVE
jgi:hypothetical protein